jgi:hypothetical protein
VQKPKKFRAVFMELKDVLGDRASEQFIAESAACLMDLYETGEVKSPRTQAEPWPDEATPRERFEATVLPGGKTVCRSKNIDRWTREELSSMSGWSGYRGGEPNLDLPSDDDLGLDAGEKLAYYIGRSKWR